MLETCVREREMFCAPSLSPWWFLKSRGKEDVGRAWLNLISKKFETLGEVPGM
jgi:hypothetical protein